jgi:hypothetical protein
VICGTRFYQWAYIKPKPEKEGTLAFLSIYNQTIGEIGMYMYVCNLCLMRVNLLMRTQKVALAGHVTSHDHRGTEW